MDDTDESLVSKVFYRTWSQLSEINLKIHKLSTRINKKTVIYFMVTSEEVSNLNYKLYSKENKSCNAISHASHSQISANIHIDGTTCQIEGDNQRNNEGNPNKSGICNKSTSVAPSTVPTNNPNQNDTLLPEYQLQQ